MAASSSSSELFINLEGWLTGHYQAEIAARLSFVNNAG